ncbi:hypothetical protein DL768_006044 [Monosporascus sp. mg162]|nr:hypothetical protein DL768_006044 [Monosporascus sp. mg162]
MDDEDISLRKPAPSPLHTSTGVSPPSSASPDRVEFGSSAGAPPLITTISRISDDAVRNPPSPVDSAENAPLAGRTFFQEEDVSPTSSPVPDDIRPRVAPTPPNDTRIVLDQNVTARPPVGSGATTISKMGSSPVPPNSVLGKGAPRTSSIDSAISAISSNRASPEATPGTTDIANLIKAAGSPEAVIQYLLKEKQSQSQQNSQLWRLVDKQRAMILGLNKDLERALKDKEKYRKKLKEVMAAQNTVPRNDSAQSTAAIVPQGRTGAAKEEALNGPPSPSNPDSDSARHSPIDVSLAPYPITPPADQVVNASSVVGELLNPTHSMPKASEHALDHFDPEEEDRAAEAAQKESDMAGGLPFNFSLPPSRGLPSEAPRGPLPNPPVAPAVSVIEATPLIDQGGPKFPPPLAPPPRKPPPAPLQLRSDAKAPPAPLEEDHDSDSDYDSLLGVDDAPILEKRGRRRTREEDDEVREVLAQKEAEARSLSKKSKKSSHKGSPTAAMPDPPHVEMPAKQRNAEGQQTPMPEDVPASLASVLSGDEPKPRTLTVPLLSPGLPASPRPMTFKSSVHSPPLSPRGMVMPAAPLSPRAPRQPIPLPPNTPLSSSSPGDLTKMTSHKSLDSAKEGTGNAQPSPLGRQSPTERGKIYRGFVTDEYPDLLLPPNALPSIEVKVASSRMKPSRASVLSLTQLEEDPVFTLAIFSRSESTELWRVEKDIASFGKLDQRMKQCPAFTCKTPDRSLFSGHSPAKLDARRVALDQYLDGLLNAPLDLQSAVEFCKYLSSNALPPNVDENGSTSELASETGSQNKGPGGRPFKNGYLTKRGKNFGGWKARFFVLDGPHLKYYEAPGGAHLGTIKLQSAQIGKQSQHNEGSSTKNSNGDELDNEYRHAFLILEPKKKDSSSYVKHVLCAESDRERDQWVETLLQWINYRENNEDEPSTSAGNDRQASGKATRANGSNTKKKVHGQARHQETHGSNNNALIGISYDSAQQGDLPDNAPPNAGTTVSPEPLDRASGSAYNISAPRDPQLISDTSSWGGKPAAASSGPSMEEKKQRKRSFFGFGPKTRGSADDHDPLYGGGSGQGAHNEPRGHTRQVFGATLTEAVKYNSPTDVSVPLPAVVYRCIQYLDLKNAILEEGIFRLSGSNIVIKQLRERFNAESDINLLTDETYYDIHAVASLLKLYLRELPTSILTRELHMQFVTVTEMPNRNEKLAAVAELVERLPQANATLLKYLIAFLIKIINHADINKMTVRNVGIVFSPTLNIPAPVFALLLQNYEAVFGIDPGEYELPSPVSEADSRTAVESQPRRPSTAGAAGSPHRQRLMEQSQQRSTPTPPLVRPNGYEPPYINQLGNGSQASLRPPYETGFGTPPSGHDHPVAPQQQQQQQQPACDRPHYSYSYDSDHNDHSAVSQDESHQSRAKKRESSMFMMGLNSQGSKSRLREEVQM